MVPLSFLVSADDVKAINSLKTFAIGLKLLRREAILFKSRIDQYGAVNSVLKN